MSQQRFFEHGGLRACGLESRIKGGGARSLEIILRLLILSSLLAQETWHRAQARLPGTLNKGLHGLLSFTIEVS